MLVAAPSRLTSFGALIRVAVFSAIFAAMAGWAGRAVADAPLPALTGRVVDDAGVLSAEAQSRIESQLKVLEDQSGIQLVVATVKSLGGDEIEPYANRLFRTWRLGEQKKNNGVLFIIVPNERRARVEVGYGLEGTLTDATTKIILANAVRPRFKEGDFSGGIARGVNDIITVLSTDKSDWEKRPEFQAQSQNQGISIGTIIVVVVIVFFLLAMFGRGRRGRGGGMIFIPGSSGTDWGSGGISGGGGSSGGDSGFSGGGGSSGGGGASDSW